MTTISITPESLSPVGATFRAVAGHRQSVGASPGQALDALTRQLDEQESGTLFVIQQMRPDRFFGDAQRTRLAELMDGWRAARDAGLPFGDQAELDRLAAAELEAATRRAGAILGEAQP